MKTKQSFQWNQLTIATCYYPEQWDESLWRNDLQRMLNSGISCIRVAEFSWNLFEPEEGRFDFSFYDHFLSIVAETKLKVIMGTPTATPPAWLSTRYPEILNCRQDGVPYFHGMRRHYNYNSTVYQFFCQRVVEQIASHYASHPSIVGWQIDNELNCETSFFYSECDTLAFRRFLQNKYGTLSTLNQAWGTVFWNQTYTDWDEIHVPRTTIHNSTNPHQTLDYLRFISDSTIHFCRMQSDILKKYVKPGDFITTNGLFSHVDSHEMMASSLDVFTYDSYPNFAFALTEDPKHNARLNDRRWSNHLSVVRSVCPHFGIMEQQAGANGWNTRLEAPAPKPGQLTLWALQSLAHGADFISFFRWRTSIMGTEMYWHGLLDQDNLDNRKIHELKQFSAILQMLQPVTGADYCAAFALLRDYDNEWDSEIDAWHRRLSWKSEEEIFIASQLNHTPMDYLYLSGKTSVDELLRYPVLFYPHPMIMATKTAALLTEYAEKGGTLILAARTGQKDCTGKCVMQPIPGELSTLAGITVQEATFIGPADEPVLMNWNEATLDTGIFNEVLFPAPDTSVLARYTGNYYKGAPALTCHPCKKGRVLYYGGTFTRENAAALLSYCNILHPWESTLSLPTDCELCVRQKNGSTYLFVLNYSSELQTLHLQRPLHELISAQSYQDDVPLSPYGVMVFVC